jgi:hypothetical protein
MITWQVTDPIDDESAVISLDVEDGNQYGKAEMEGDKPLINVIEGYMLTASGAFGHRINLDSVSAIDLDYALRSSYLAVEITEGKEIVESYDPGIPEGALT